MTSSVTVPAVYVGAYHQYNGGGIFGKWFDLTDFDDEDEFYDACRALHAAEDDPSLCFRTERDPSQFASESSVRVGVYRGIPAGAGRRTRCRVCGWADYTGECDYDAFDEAYCGGAESEEDFAYGFVEDHGLLKQGCLNPCASISIMRLTRGICSAAAMSSMRGYVFSN